MNLNLSPEHLQIVKEILLQHVPNTKVWAFGSRVKFTNEKYADLDLVVVGEQKQPLTRMADLEEAFLESDLPFEVDVLDYCRISENMRAEIGKNYIELQNGTSVQKT